MRRLCAYLLGAALFVTLLASAIYFTGTNAPLMTALMTRFAPQESTRLPEAEYPAVAEMITGYLSGRADTFQHTFQAVDGTLYLCFHTREQQHMADCRNLFTLCRRVMIASAVLSLLLTALLWHDRKNAARRCRRGLIACTAALLIAAIAAAVDFDAVFVLFHRLLFTNDLWLMDPATDLIIRLMPLELFISYAAIIGTILAIGIAIMITATVIVQKKTPS